MTELLVIHFFTYKAGQSYQNTEQILGESQTNAFHVIKREDFACIGINNTVAA